MFYLNKMGNIISIYCIDIPYAIVSANIHSITYLYYQFLTIAFTITILLIILLYFIYY